MVPTSPSGSARSNLVGSPTAATALPSRRSSTKTLTTAFSPAPSGATITSSASRDGLVPAGSARVAMVKVMSARPNTSAMAGASAELVEGDARRREPWLRSLSPTVAAGTPRSAGKQRAGQQLAGADAVAVGDDDGGQARGADGGERCRARGARAGDARRGIFDVTARSPADRRSG